MTDLNCNATTCMHNTGNLCSRGAIHVGGKSAKSTEQTCCNSFAERQSGFENSIEAATETVDIACKADTCSYNDGGRCFAEHVDVSGFTARETEDTNCSTFIRR